MIGYKYKGFEIKDDCWSNNFYTIFKDGYRYSILALSSIKAAKTVIDTSFPSDTDEKLIPIFNELETVDRDGSPVYCLCGCGETFCRDKFGKKKFIQGHNNYLHYKKLKNETTTS